MINNNNNNKKGKSMKKDYYTIKHTFEDGYMSGLTMNIKHYKQSKYKYHHVCTRKELKEYYFKLKNINVTCHKYEMGYYFIGCDGSSNTLVAHAMNLSNKRYCFYILKELLENNSNNQKSA